MQQCVCGGTLSRDVASDASVCVLCGMIIEVQDETGSKHVHSIALPEYIPKQLEITIRHQASSLFAMKTEWQIKRSDPAMSMAAACIYCVALCNDIIISKKDLASLNNLTKKKITDEHKNLNDSKYDLIDPFECVPTDRKIINTFLLKIKYKVGVDLPDIVDDCVEMISKVTNAGAEQSRHAKTICAAVIYYFLFVSDKYITSQSVSEHQVIDALGVHAATLESYLSVLASYLTANIGWGYNV